MFPGLVWTARKKRAGMYVRGLMMTAERKSPGAMVRYVAGGDEQSMRHVVTESA